MQSVALLPALALVGGAVFGVVGEFPWATAPVAALSVLLLAVAGAAWACARGRALSLVICAVTACSCAGFALATDAKARALDTPLRALLDREFGGFAIDTLGPGGSHDPVRMRGVLAEDAAWSPDFTSMRVRLTMLELRGAWHPVEGSVTLSIGGSRRPGPVDPPEWVAGRAIETMATFRRPARYLNAGVPDFERDIALDGTTLFGSVKSALLVEIVARGHVVEELGADVRRHVRRAVHHWVAPHGAVSAAIVIAVLIGDRTGLPDDIRLRLQAAGTYHVIAISGGNIAILAALSFAVLLACGFAGRASAAVTLLLLLAYAVVVTSGPSVWRATLMAVLYLGARLLDHRTPPWQAMAVAAGVLVCARPLDVRDVGFILTFGATAALIAVAGRAQGEGGRGKRGNRLARRWLVASLAASAAAEIALLPVSAWAFSRVTSAGLVLNLIAVPMMTLVQVGGMVVALADSVPAVASVGGWVAHHAAATIVSTSALVDAAPWLARRVPPPALGLVLLYYAALAAALTLRGRLRLAGGAALLISAAAISTGVQPAALLAHADAPHLRLTSFDIGQGDAALLEFPDRSTLLVDAGGIPFGASGFDIGARVLAPALWARGVRRLDALLLTHGDPDHIGGARSLLADFDPGELWQGIAVPRHIGLQAVLQQATLTGARVVERTAGQHLEAGGVRIRVLHPPPGDWERPRVRNDDSVVLEVLHGDIALLLTGDIGADVERAILPQLTPARVRVLKVAHHGSRTSSSRELLDAWRPNIALISSGRGNTFGHPTPEVLQRLADHGTKVYRTDVEGQITVESDGRGVRVSTYRGGR